MASMNVCRNLVKSASNSFILNLRRSVPLASSRGLLTSSACLGTSRVSLIFDSVLTPRLPSNRFDVRQSYAPEKGLLKCYSTEVNVDLSFDDFQALIKSGDIQLIDVREPKELIEYGKYPGAVNIPLGQLQAALAMPVEEFRKTFNFGMPKAEDSNIVFACLKGIRSKKAIDVANQVGFKKTRHYKGGWEDYHKQMGLPLKQNPSS